MSWAISVDFQKIIYFALFHHNWKKKVIFVNFWKVAQLMYKKEKNKKLRPGSMTINIFPVHFKFQLENVWWNCFQLNFICLFHNFYMEYDLINMLILTWIIGYFTFPERIGLRTRSADSSKCSKNQPESRGCTSTWIPLLSKCSWCHSWGIDRGLGEIY